jgi:hypothetical protein
VGVIDDTYGRRYHVYSRRGEYYSEVVLATYRQMPGEFRCVESDVDRLLSLDDVRIPCSSLRDIRLPTRPT